ncbi:MAG: acetylglucosamine-6-sulfatase [Candidatus Epulonipiscioides saccharophilum]|nr:MAG: acetylglucosamine-6-sulfatase [Epulopiscium sp. AS2M-Bin001]
MKKPNILYFMSDDHASNAISCYNSILSEVFQTPNFDRLANEGCRLNNYCATNSICTPARATIMTGQYGHLNGVKTLADRWNSDTKLNLAQLIKDSGYDTAFFGKWHLQCVPNGFDEYKYLEGSGQQGVYINPTFAEKGSEGIIKHEGYVTEIITDMTLNWLKNKNSDQPFFIMCNHKAPHDRWQYLPKYEHIFDGVEIPEPGSLFEDLSHRSAGSFKFGSTLGPNDHSYNKLSLFDWFNEDNYVTGKIQYEENATDETKTKLTYQKYLKDYLRTVAGIDESVGQIVNYLESIGELDNTVVIYTSDQGMFLGEHSYWDKRWSFEESINTPFLIRYPKEISAGGVNNELLSNLDIAPLLLDYAGAEIPEEMQGKSFRKVLTGEEHGYDAIYFRYWMHLTHHGVPSHYGIKTKEYKLIYYYGKPLGSTGAINVDTPTGWELYNLKNDPLELQNIYNDKNYSNIVEKLKIQLQDIKEKYQDYN